MANARLATSSLFATVTTVANTASNIVGTVNDAVSIGNNFVSRHLQMQQDKNKVELHLGRTRLIEDTAMEISERRKATAERLKDETFKAIYEKAHTDLSALFATNEEA